MKQLIQLIVIAAISAMTFAACNDSAVGNTKKRKEPIEPPAKTGDVLLDGFNLADRLIGVKYGDAREMLDNDDWYLYDKNDYYLTYSYVKVKDSLEYDLTIDFGYLYEVVYVCITISDPSFWDEEGDYFASEEKSLNLIEHIGDSCKLSNNVVCNCCGYHSYNGVDNNDGDDYESLIRDFHEYWGLRYFEATWMSKDENTFISFGSACNAVHNYVSISISRPLLSTEYLRIL